MSSAIASLEFDVNTGITTVAFHTGGIYTWQNIPYAIFIEWRNSSSWGKYFHANIKDKYT